MIRFFNVWNVQLDGVAIHIASRKQVALLAYLALENKQRHSRQTLLGLLWPEMGEAEARNNLRVALAGLRRVLGKAGATLIGSNRQEVWFQAEQVWVDVAEVAELLAACEVHSHEGRASCAACQHRLAEAATLYRGELLHGFYLSDCLAFDEWLMMRRERHHLQMMEILGELAYFVAGQGETQTAVSHRRRQLELDPFHEEAHQHLLQLWAQQGQANLALAHFEQYQQLLHQELGAAPTATMLELVEKLRMGQPVAANRAGEGEKTAVSPPAQNLPHYLTPFSGREQERQQIRQRLQARSYRLLTVVGPGGMGKTRLATQIADENGDLFADGVGFVPLAPIQSADAVPAAIAQALDIAFDSSVQGEEEQLVAHLQGKELLLVLDNLEHLLDVIDLILNILNHCPQVVVLATSRERLNAHAEDLFYLEGLPFPREETAVSTTTYASIELFVNRAQRLDKSFRLTEENLPAIIRICQQVEGMPLGIELAAAWVEDFDCAEIARTIASNLDFLTADYHDMAARHQSLRAVFDHSWQLLTAQEQQVLSRLSVFRGSFTLEQAMAVADAVPQISRRLRNKSLLRSLGGRLFDLHELIRQFAAEQLAKDGGVRTAVYQKHSDTYLTLLAAQAPRLQRADQANALELIEQAYENILQAWEWGLARQNIPLLQAGRDALMLFLSKRNRYEEGIKLCQTSSDRPLTDLHFRAMLLAWHGFFANRMGRHETARRLLLEAQQQINSTAYETILDRAFIFFQLGQSFFQSNLEQAKSYYYQSLSLYQQRDEPWQMSQVLEALTAVLHDLGQHDEASQRGAQNLAIRQQLAIPSELASALTALMPLKLDSREFDLAEQYGKEAIAICRQINDRRSLAESLAELSLVYLWSGKVALAPPLVWESIALFANLGARQLEAYWRNRLALYLLHLGQYETVQTLLHETARMSDGADNERVSAWTFQLEALALMGQKRYEAAEPLLRQAYGLFAVRNNLPAMRFVHIYQGIVLFHLGQHERARQLWLPILAESVQKQLMMCLLTALAGISLWLAAVGRVEEAVRVFTRVEMEPFFRPSQWYADVAGSYVWERGAKLPPDRFQMAREGGKTAVLWELGCQIQELVSPVLEIGD
ncbi:MAG: BTAD domain-containing putative transcriptional regulator [Chloroflexota bacterium]